MCPLPLKICSILLIRSFCRQLFRVHAAISGSAIPKKTLYLKKTYKLRFLVIVMVLWKVIYIFFI